MANNTVIVICGATGCGKSYSLDGLNEKSGGQLQIIRPGDDVTIDWWRHAAIVIDDFTPNSLANSSLDLTSLEREAKVNKKKLILVVQTLEELHHMKASFLYTPILYKVPEYEKILKLPIEIIGQELRIDEDERISICQTFGSIC